MKAQSSCIPQRKITPNGTKQPEWFNKSIAEAISNRQKAYNISKLRPSPETKVAHIKECKLIRRAKLNEEDRVAAAAKDNPKAFFAHVNSRKPVKNTIGPLKDRTGSIISTDEGMANIFNEYFASVYTEEDTSEIPIVPIVYRGNNPLRRIEITVDKVKMKLKKLNSNKSAGPDGFYPRVIKETEEETAPRFCNIFRTSLEQRKAVRDWKLQNISPLFKKGSKDDPGNYRPISLTSVPGKMLESIIADDMMSHLEHNKLILDSQHGFRSGRSCLTNLVDFFHDMFSIYDKSRAVDILFQEYKETCLFTKHESLQGDSPRVCTNILKCSLHSLVTKGIRLVGFATRAMVCESPTHYLILNSLAIARGRVILRSHFLILLLLIILISLYILTYFSLLQ